MVASVIIHCIKCSIFPTEISIRELCIESGEFNRIKRVEPEENPNVSEDCLHMNSNEWSLKLPLYPHPPPQRWFIYLKVFGEGLTILNGTIRVFTWRSGTGYLLDENTLELLDTFKIRTTTGQVRGGGLLTWYDDVIHAVGRLYYSLTLLFYL